MSRPPRVEVPDGIFHLWARGNERQLIFRDDVDYRRFLEILAGVVVRYRWRVLTYCLIGNHHHLLVQTPGANRAGGMRQLNGVYAQSFNRRHGRVGHLFQGRHGAVLVQDDDHLCTVCRYIVRNPTSTRFPVHPAEWPWSSHRAVLGLDPPPPFLDLDGLLAYFGPTETSARERYRVFVEESESEPSGHPLVEGDAKFVAHHVAAVPPCPEFPRRYGLPPPPLAELVPEGADSAAIAVAHREHGYSMRQIATHLGCGIATVSRRISAYEAEADGARNVVALTPGSRTATVREHDGDSSEGIAQQRQRRTPAS